MQRAPRAHSCVLCEIRRFGAPRPAAGRPCLKHGRHKSAFLALCEFCERVRRPRAGGGAVVARPRHPTRALWDFREKYVSKKWPPGHLFLFFHPRPRIFRKFFSRPVWSWGGTAGIPVYSARFTDSGRLGRPRGGPALSTGDTKAHSWHSASFAQGKGARAPAAAP